MPDLASLREGLRKNLATIPECQVSAYRLGSPIPPTLQVVGPDEAEATSFGRGGESLVMIVLGLVGQSSDISAQRRLDLWWATTGAQSVVAAIEADRTLSGVADTLVVIRKGGYGIYNLPNQADVLGAEWRVQIETSN